ncbi:zinc-binding dehydrogenase [Nakamurella sp. YIM 132087]|uniref:Zinc-binding dehydrogenase n=1 Tax=Nakamurella alba TaxID=2665158 RepID=A0A7K1FT56_9ACTN|nr:zinc-binding dehydrogenase [Nakamurella alba]
MTVTGYGGPEVLTVEKIDVSAPGEGQVQVRVAAAGINFIDIYRRQGVYPEPLPNVPGREGAGTVMAIGPGVDGVAVGDRVAWCDVHGSYAGLVNAPAAALIPVPDGVDDQQAAAFPLQGLTAHYLATDSYPVRPGDTVLVHAGAGGVGLLLTRIARIRGARVITTVSTDAKAELSRDAGADEIIVGYQDFEHKVRELTGGAGVQAVYDGVGKDTFDASLASLAVRGTMVLFGGSSGQVPPFDPQRLNGLGSLYLTRPTLAHFTRTRAELLARSAEVLGWIADGRLEVRIGGTYPLADAARAQEDLAGRRSTGKLLLLP